MRPTWSEPLASPFGCVSLAEASSSRAEFAAPAETTTMSPRNVFGSPSWVTSTPVTVEPAASVVSLVTSAFVSSVTLGCSRAGRTPKISASDLPWTSDGKPSQVAHRMHGLNGMFVSWRRTPHGAWNGW